jgi:hypothetical protein
MSATLDLHCGYLVLSDDLVVTGVSVIARGLPAPQILYEHSSLVDHGSGRYSPEIDESARELIERVILPHSARVLAQQARIVAPILSALRHRDRVVVSVRESFKPQTADLLAAEMSLGDSFYTWVVEPFNLSQRTNAHFAPPGRDQEPLLWTLLDHEDFLAPLRYESLRASLRHGD